jgi:ribosomal protein S27AE
MSKEYSIAYRERMILDGKCPQCGEFKFTEKDQERYYCFKCRRIRAEADRKANHARKEIRKVSRVISNSEL